LENPPNYVQEKKKYEEGVGSEVKQKVSPAMNRFMGRADIDHGSDLVKIHWGLG
jgi:hypothetical protein